MHFRTYLALGLVALVAGLIAYPFTFARAQPPVCDKPCDKPCPFAGRCSLGRKVVRAKVPSMLVNSRRIKLNYTIKEVGPSGVSRLELWATRDGKSWARYSNEPPPSGPLVVQVAEEGKYGFHIVVRNGVGVGSPQPKEGDAPQMWVVVDETKPMVKVHSVSVLKKVDEPTLSIRWTARDERLMPHPMTICTALKPEGPWTPVATALENSGRYLYRLPKEHPYEFFVRVEAMDKAGNVGGDHCLEPVHVDTMRPRGVIIGVDAEKVARLPVVVPAAVKTVVKVEQKPVLQFLISGGAR